jgi:hypothetical protein
MKPSDFFVGTMEIFAILMPGAVLAFLLLPWVPQVFGPALPALDSEPSRWLAFAVSAYLLGHLLQHLGSFLDSAYDKFYAANKRKQGDEPLLIRARELTQADLGTDLRGVNNFNWANAYVRVHNIAAATDIERLSADSKLFRSLCLVFVLASVLLLFRPAPLATFISLVLAVFSYHRFCKQRWTATQRTYEYFAILRREVHEQCDVKKTLTLG